MNELLIALLLFLAQQEPAFDVESFRDKLRRSLETRCLIQPYFRECRNLENPSWRPPVPRCPPRRDEISSLEPVKNIEVKTNGQGAILRN